MYLSKRQEEQESELQVDEENTATENVQVIPADCTPKLQEMTNTSRRKVRNRIIILLLMPFITHWDKYSQKITGDSS